jgi:hypothetical protein
MWRRRADLILGTVRDQRRGHQALVLHALMRMHPERAGYRRIPCHQQQGDRVGHGNAGRQNLLAGSEHGHFNIFNALARFDCPETGDQFNLVLVRNCCG